MKRNMDQWTKDLLEAPVKKAVHSAQAGGH